MKLDELKAYLGILTDKYRSLGLGTQQLITTALGGGIGAGLGSISLGKDSAGRHRGYLLGSNKDNSRAIGFLTGAIAGVHVPTVK